MDRLTKPEFVEVDGRKTVMCVSDEKDCDGSCIFGNCDWNRMALEKLKEYEDLEEQGLLLLLPKNGLCELRMAIKNSILHYLCDDWNNNKRGKAHKENQAVFDKEYGYAIWNDTDLEMVMEKVVKGIWSADIEKHLQKWRRKSESNTHTSNTKSN